VKNGKNFTEIDIQYDYPYVFVRGYFIASNENVTDELIKEYIKNQDLEERSNSNNFEIEEE